MIFGEGEATTLVSVLGLAVGAVATLGVAYLTYRTNRDRLAFDAKMVRLEAQCDACERAHKEDQAQILLLRAEVDRLRDLRDRPTPAPPDATTEKKGEAKPP